MHCRPPLQSFSALITSFIMHQPIPNFNKIEQCMDESVSSVPDLEKMQNNHWYPEQEDVIRLFATVCLFLDILLQQIAESCQ